MWIKEMPSELHESNSIGVNFLYRQDKIYVMDNHLCASWCWLQHTDLSKKYNFVHIDYHYDLSGDPDRIESEVTKKNVQLHQLSFDEYRNLKFKVESLNIEAKLFRWDNFILNINDAYPSLFATTTFVTKRGGSKEDFVQDEEELEHFISEFEHWLGNIQGGWIIDLDVDFFFSKTRGRYYQLYSDEVIRILGLLLKKNMNKIDVLTIALSPECCGGWDNAFRVFAVLKEALELDM